MYQELERDLTPQELLLFERLRKEMMSSDFISKPYAASPEILYQLIMVAEDQCYKCQLLEINCVEHHYWFGTPDGVIEGFFTDCDLL